MEPANGQDRGTTQAPARTPNQPAHPITHEPEGHMSGAYTGTAESRQARVSESDSKSKQTTFIISRNEPPTQTSEQALTTSQLQHRQPKGTHRKPHIGDPRVPISANKVDKMRRLGCPRHGTSISNIFSTRDKPDKFTSVLNPKSGTQTSGQALTAS